MLSTFVFYEQRDNRATFRIGARNGSCPEVSHRWLIINCGGCSSFPDFAGQAANPPADESAGYTCGTPDKSGLGMVIK